MAQRPTVEDLCSEIGILHVPEEADDLFTVLSDFLEWATDYAENTLYRLPDTASDDNYPIAFKRWILAKAKASYKRKLAGESIQGVGDLGGFALGPEAADIDRAMQRFSRLDGFA